MSYVYLVQKSRINNSGNFSSQTLGVYTNPSAAQDHMDALFDQYGDSLGYEVDQYSPQQHLWVTNQTTLTELEFWVDRMPLDSKFEA